MHNVKVLIARVVASLERSEFSDPTEEGTSKRQCSKSQEFISDTEAILRISV